MLLSFNKQGNLGLETQIVFLGFGELEQHPRLITCCLKSYNKIPKNSDYSQNVRL